MDTHTMESKIEQLEVTLSGVKGLLNDIIMLASIHTPVLRQIPSVNKDLLTQLELKMQIAERLLMMDRQDPPTIVKSSF